MKLCEFHCISPNSHISTCLSQSLEHNLRKMSQNLRSCQWHLLYIDLADQAIPILWTAPCIFSSLNYLVYLNASRFFCYVASPNLSPVWLSRSLILSIFLLKYSALHIFFIFLYYFYILNKNFFPADVDISGLHCISWFLPVLRLGNPLAEKS